MSTIRLVLNGWIVNSAQCCQLTNPIRAACLATIVSFTAPIQERRACPSMTCGLMNQIERSLLVSCAGTSATGGVDALLLGSGGGDWVEFLSSDHYTVLQGSSHPRHDAYIRSDYIILLGRFSCLQKSALAGIDRLTQSLSSSSVNVTRAIPSNLSWYRLVTELDGSG
jgi:hypothetical protein